MLIVGLFILDWPVPPWEEGGWDRCSDPSCYWGCQSCIPPLILPGNGVPKHQARNLGLLIKKFCCEAIKGIHDPSVTIWVAYDEYTDFVQYIVKLLVIHYSHIISGNYLLCKLKLADRGKILKLVLLAELLLN